MAVTLPNAAQAAAVPTATTLALSSPTVASTAAVTLTATVVVVTGGAPVTNGSVNFCDASAPRCEDSAIVGKAQLTAGTAKLKFIPGIGAHRKRALLHHFGSARTVARAGLAELERVDGISKRVAKKIYEHFHVDG